MIIDYSLQVPTFLLRTECQNKVDGPGETPWVMPKKVALQGLEVLSICCYGYLCCNKVRL